MSDPLFSITDRVTLISGGSRGIGKALAAGFVQRGARVIVTGRQAETLEETVRELAAGTEADVRGRA